MRKHFDIKLDKKKIENLNFHLIFMIIKQMKLIKFLYIAGEKSKDGESKETTKNEDAKKGDNEDGKDSKNGDKVEAMEESDEKKTETKTETKSEAKRKADETEPIEVSAEKVAKISDEKEKSTEEKA